MRLSSDELRLLPEGDQDVKEKITSQVDSALNMLAISRTIGAIERRLDESLNMKASDLQDLEWADVADGLLRQVETTLDQAQRISAAPQGQIRQNIDAVLNRTASSTTDENRLIDLLLNMSAGPRLAIDPRTHQRGMRRVIAVQLHLHCRQTYPG